MTKLTPLNDTPGQRLADELQREFPESRMARELSELARATSTNRNGVTEPDNRVRLAAIQTALAYRVGKPIERSEIRTQAVSDGESLEERLARAPEFRRMLQELLEKAAPVVDV